MKNKLLFIAMVFILISASATAFAYDRASQFASAVTIDDDQDGYVDAIDIYLSNTIDDGIDGNTDWDALNLANIANDFWIGGDYFLLIEYVTTGANTEDNLFRLHVRTQEDLGTGFEGNITVGYSYNSSRKIWDQEDPQGWLVSFNQQEISDGAAPLLYEMITVDTDDDDFIDQIKVVFSESLNPNFYPRSGATPNVIFSFSDNIYSQAQFAHNGFGTQNATNDVYIMDIINATALNNGQPTYKYNPYLSRDGFNNDGPYALRDISSNANFAVYPGGPVVLDAFACKDESGTFIKIQMSDIIDPATVQKEDFEIYISGNAVELTDANTISVTQEREDFGIVSIRLPGIPNGLIARNTVALVGLNAVRSVDGGGNVIYSPVDVKDRIKPEAMVAATENIIFEGGLTQTVIVTYNEPMDPATAPDVVFTSSNWGEAANGMWSTATYANDTYIVEFTHNGTQEEILEEYATVSDTSGATDAVGNNDEGAESTTFVLDTKKAIPQITVSEATIFEGLLTQEVTVVYDEAMDTQSTPTITLTGANWGEQQSIGWSTTTYDNDTFKATFTHNGNQETLQAFAEVAEGSGALDIHGNGDIAGNSQGFTVDTEKPVVTMVERSNSTIFESSLFQTITVYYNESMDSTSAPQITFTSNNWQPALDRFQLRNWSTTTNHNDTYTMRFVHNGTEEYIAEEIATVSDGSGALDIAGNADVGSTSNPFLVDTQQPTPTITVDVDPVFEGMLTQTVVVTYDESMDPVTAPVITVDGTNWGEQAEGNWSSVNVTNDTYTTTFVHNGTEEEIVSAAHIAAASGALDAVGNTEKAGDSDNFDVDTDKPSCTIATTIEKIWEGSLTQTVVVVYDESMDTESAPVITLTGDNWGEQTTVGWSTTVATNDTYTATFTHNGTQETASVGAFIQQGSGAVDIAGNAENGNESPGFDIDTKKPSAISVNADVDPVFGGELTQTITVIYDEPMDPSTTPEIVLSGGHWGEQTTVGWSSSELDNDTYTATFTHDGSDQITQCTATISVGNATDAAGNTETGEQSTDFWIRVGTPEAVVDLTHQTIYEGQLVQIITITYDEAMNIETTPTITLDGDNWGQFMNGAWSTTTLDNDTYTVAVTHDGTEEFIRTVNVNVSGAADISGNPGGQASGIFKLDTKRPNVTIGVEEDPIFEDNLTQTINLVFSESMDTLTAVNLDSIMINGSNWSEFQAVGWTTTNVANDTYVIATTHNGTPEYDWELVSVATDCGVLDIAGNSSNGTEGSGFDIDTRKPELIDIDFQFGEITTNNYRQGVAVHFNEHMDHDTTPIVTLSAGSWNAEPIDGRWVNLNQGQRLPKGDVYVLYFDHTETPEEIDSVKASISGVIKDFAGNTFIVPVESDTMFAIDTQKPQPTVSVTVDPVEGIGRTQIVEIIYSESMTVNDTLPNTIPVITLNGDNWGMQENIGWSTTTLPNDTFTARFVHNGTEEEIDEVFASVTEGSAGYDLAGNLATDATSQAFELDTKRPVAVVTSAIQQIYENNLTQTVTVVFDEPMNTETAPRIFIVNPNNRNGYYWQAPVSRGWSTTTLENDTYTAEFTHDGSPEEVVGYTAVVADSMDATDLAGNFTRGDSDAPGWNVDTRKPTSMATSTSYETGTIYVNWTAEDFSGIKNVKLYARSSEEEFTLADTDETGDSTGTFMYQIESGTQGDYYFYTVATDNPGNVETDFLVDGIPDAHENVDIIAVKFIINTIPENPRVGEYFSIEIDAVNEDDLRDPDYDAIINFSSNYPASVTLPEEMQILGGYGVFDNCLATESMNDLQINVWDALSMGLFSTSNMITVVPTEVAPPTQAMVYDVPNDQGGRVYIDYMLSVNDPFYTGEEAVMPAINYYVVERYSKSDMQDSTGIWQAVAFVDLYQPSNGNTASVFLNVPGSDTLMHYRMGSVYISGINQDVPNVVRATEKSRGRVIYAGDDNNPMTRDAVQSTMVYCGSAAASDNLPAYADIKVYLEGAYQGNGIMGAAANLPLVSPYDGQQIEALPEVNGHEVIDWIWVEVRYLADGETVKAANAFVLDNGSIVDVNGSKSLPYYYTTGENYFVVVKHHNHVSAMTSNRYSFSDIQSNLPVIDFAQDIYENGAKQVEENVFALYAGDIDGLNGVGPTDKVLWSENYGSMEYSSADIDLDGSVGPTDKVLWSENYGRATAVPEHMDLVAVNEVRDGIEKQKSNTIVRVTPNVEFILTNKTVNTYEDGEYFEFDIEASASEASKLYTSFLRISYNTDAFGQNIVESGNLSVIRTGISADVIDPAGPAPEAYKYSIDQGDSRNNLFAIGTSWNFEVNGYRNYDNATELNSRRSLMHVAIKFADGAQNIDPEIAFDLATPNSQQLHFTTPGSDDYAAYGNINLRTTASCEIANQNFAVGNGSITINWDTTDETSNLVGFGVGRNTSNTLVGSEMITETPIIKGSGVANSYNFEDNSSFVAGTTYYYWITAFNADETFDMFGPYEVTYNSTDAEDITKPVFVTELLQNTPNPFNPVTRLNYSLSQKSDVTIEVFNVKGQKVKTFNEGSKSEGEHHVTWKGNDESGKAVGSGVYFYRLRAGNVTQIKKAMLLK